jgi:hypothetical protein
VPQRQYFQCDHSSVNWQWSIVGCDFLPLSTNQALDIFNGSFASVSVIGAIRFTSPSEGRHRRFHGQPHVNERSFCRCYRTLCRLAVHQGYRALRCRPPSTESCLNLCIEMAPCQVDVCRARRGQPRLRRQRDDCGTQHQQFMNRHGLVSRVDNAVMTCRHREGALLVGTPFLGRLDRNKSDFVGSFGQEAPAMASIPGIARNNSAPSRYCVFAQINRFYSQRGNIRRSARVSEQYATHRCPSSQLLVGRQFMRRKMEMFAALAALCAVASFLIRRPRKTRSRCAARPGAQT